MESRAIEQRYAASREMFAERGVDTEQALKTLEAVSVSLHCWQGDDVGGFEKSGAAALGDGGLQVTGHYPGKARTIEELQSDLHLVFSFLPGRKHRLNLHAIYGDFRTKPADRDEIGPEHFQGWLDWARKEKLGLDFNATCFSHPLSDSGYTLSSSDKTVRAFWVEHVKRCRSISAYLGRELRSPCLHNLWIPDGAKEAPADRWAPRARLKESLDAVLAVEHSPLYMKDSLESKLFGIGSESYVVGSHEFYMGYCLVRKKMVCLDLGHFHPTESVADKISALLLFFPEILLHISRGVRWDSDHVVILDDNLKELCGEVIRNGLLGRVHLALDYFDASLNRLAAWIIGARALLKGLLWALLEPAARLRDLEAAGDKAGWLALREETNTLPHGPVWDYHCLRQGVPPADLWLSRVRDYEADVLSKRR